MEENVFHIRVKKAMDINELNQSEIAKKQIFNKSLIFNYLSGKYKIRTSKFFKCFKNKQK